MVEKSSPPGKPAWESGFRPSDYGLCLQSPVSDLVDSPQFQKLVKSVEDCSKPLASGTGRKTDMLIRVTSVKESWEDVPPSTQKLLKKL